MTVLGSLVAGLVSGAAWAQPATRSASIPVQSLAVAEGALIDALLRRDSSAFQRMLTADSVFALPVVTKGPEAIVKAWLPFLIEGGATMMISTSARFQPARWRSRGGASTLLGR
jgi:hypothetical protein